MKSVLVCFILFVAWYTSNAQEPEKLKERYNHCFDSLRIVLQNNGSFKQAVFLTENCFITELSYDAFDRHISTITSVVRAWMQANPVTGYRYNDSINLHSNFGIYTCLKDTIVFINEGEKKYLHLPYSYDFHDFFGRTDWSNMFVTKLLATRKGNCHSLPYLYKMVADELGASCWLGLAPNHIYIKNRCRKMGWYNTELTSGTFPIDAWITASGYIPLQAIQNGIYMDTLSNQQALALCVLDLAKGYEFQTRSYYDGFILKCCDLVLQYHPVNVQAMLLKAETLKRIYEQQQHAREAVAAITYQEMEQLYIRLFDLGYREMPEEMYHKWLRSVHEHINRQVTESIHRSKKS